MSTKGKKSARAPLRLPAPLGAACDFVATFIMVGPLGSYRGLVMGCRTPLLPTSHLQSSPGAPFKHFLMRYSASTRHCLMVLLVIALGVHHIRRRYVHFKARLDPDAEIALQNAQLVGTTPCFLVTPPLIDLIPSLLRSATTRSETSLSQVTPSPPPQLSGPHS